MTLAAGMLLLGGAGISYGIGSAYADEVVGTPNGSGGVSASTTFTVEIPDSLSLSLDTDKVNLNITGADFNRLMTDTVNVTYSSSNRWGYTLSMASDGVDNSLAYQDGEGTTAAASIPSITQPTQASAMKANSWGYSLDQTEYKPIPVNGGNTTIAEGYNTNSSTLPVTVGVIVDGNIPAGTYKDTLVFTLIGTAAPDSVRITWDPNEGTLEDNTTELDISSSLGTLPTPTRYAHHFDGWFTAKEGGEQVTSATVPRPASVTYYAHWTKVETAMQDITSCDEITGETMLYDKRDGKVYTVNKLADGKCWMTQNLALIDTEISAENSDMAGASDNFTVPTSTDPAVTAWCNTNDTECDDKTMAYYNSDKPEYGAYYNWFTATAGTGRYANIDSKGEDAKDGDTIVAGKDAKWSICPKGWRLPSVPDYDNSEFKILLGNYLDELGNPSWVEATSDTSAHWTGSGFSTKMTEIAPKYQTAGYINTDSVNSSTTVGVYWSSSAASTAYARDLSFNDTPIRPRYNSSKWYGFSVRCVFGG